MKQTYKIFLVDWSATNEVHWAAALELTKRRCEIVYWIGEPPPRRTAFRGTIFQGMQEALLAQPVDGIDCSRFEPPSRRLLEQLSECESLTLCMMDRVDYSNVSFHRKKRLYYNLLKHWHGVLQHKRPDAIVFSTTPHAIYDFVLYSLAKLFLIKTIIFLPVVGVHTRFRSLVISDIQKESKELLQVLQGSPNVRLEDLSKDIQDYYLLSENIPKDASRSSSHAALFGRVWASVQSGDFFLKIFLRAKWYVWYIFYIRPKRWFGIDPAYAGLAYWRKRWEWHRAKENFKKEYESLQLAVDWSKKFIFAPLHYQPERSTSPEGGVFADQFLMIDILSHAAPPDWVIYVKEHPRKWTRRAHMHQSRHKGYYKEIVSLPNVRLVPMDIPSGVFIERCQAVATITGGIGWEAIVRGKPALVFGYPAYKECTEIFKVSDVASVREAIGKIRDGYTPDQQKILNYLGALDKVSVRAQADLNFYKKFPVHSAGETAKNIADAVFNELQKA